LRVTRCTEGSDGVCVCVCTQFISEVDNAQWEMDMGSASYINGKMGRGGPLER